MKEVFANYIKTEGITFKHAKGMRDITGKEFHPYHELFLFQGGDAEFISEKLKYKLQPNALVMIPKESFHQFVVYGDEDDYLRCVLNFTDIPEFERLIREKMNEVRVFQATAEILYSFHRLVEGYRLFCDSYEAKLLLKSLFVLILLSTDSKTSENADGPYEQFSHITQEALTYINRNIDSDVAISSIARDLHISVSHLNHCFKKDLHIPIHKYILNKKLINANRQIRTGIIPTEAAINCGFRDYSGFYRQYKKMFNIPPSKTSDVISEQ